MWARGLKHQQKRIVHQHIGVAPHVGAWIETQKKTNQFNQSQSRPMWARGLKLIRCSVYKMLD